MKLVNLPIENKMKIGQVKKKVITNQKKREISSTLTSKN